jgi:hypothetical protein
MSHGPKQLEQETKQSHQFYNGIAHILIAQANYVENGRVCRLQAMSSMKLW